MQQHVSWQTYLEYDMPDTRSGKEGKDGIIWTKTNWQRSRSYWAYRYLASRTKEALHF